MHTIPPQLFGSQLPTGGHEFFCYLVFEPEESAAIQGSKLTWAIVAEGDADPAVSGTRRLTERDAALGRLPIAAVLPAAWQSGQLRVGLHPAAGDFVQATYAIQRFVQPGPFHLPLTGPILIVGGHRLGEVHRLAWAISSQQFAWDFLPLASPEWSVFNAPLMDQPQAANFTGFGCDVVAPAPGQIVRAVGDQPDLIQVGELPAPDAYADDLTRALGNYIVIDHGQGVWSLLAHLRYNSVQVQVGQTVALGQRLARVGNSGHSSGPHLHCHFMDGPDLLTASPLPVTLDVEGQTHAPQAGELLVN